MRDYVFGANILENLTDGMYKDSKVIYREYIQNSCDQIDKAIQMGMLKSGIGSKEQGYGEVEIWLDTDDRNITIEDNATGIKAADFAKVLGNIADSDKKIGEDKGFRGIGRLCGLAYCRELVFTSKAKGENIISVLRCDALKMRKLIAENANGAKHSAVEVLNSINKFETLSTDDIDSHYFKVEMNHINEENTDLLDSKQVKNYLSFVAPVPYQNYFSEISSDIHNHAKSLNYKIDEYNIKLEGESIVKKYSKKFKTQKMGEDEINDIKIKDFFDDSGKLIAWMWFGLSRFKGIIDKNCLMRGLRLRKENIQIGNEEVFQKLFSEDRGPLYFVGEVFAVSKDLIPNSQRDYFNENETRVIFENLLKRYFYDILRKIYRESSEINRVLNKINKPNQTELIITDKAHAKEEKKHLKKLRLNQKKQKKNWIKNSKKQKKLLIP